MTAKQPPRKRVAGFLVCDACRRAISYQGYEDPGMETWPEHRCAAAGAHRSPRPFNRFVLEDPFRPSLPPMSEAS